jgi:alpha-tubulin suppressor-like RCC1 family protein
LSPNAARLAGLCWLLISSCSRVSDVLTLNPENLPDASGQTPDAAPDAAAPGTLTTSSVDSGVGHSCATLHGVLYCWGDNSRGQLGLGDTTARDRPTRIGVLGDWARVAAGANHSCALRSDGTAHCFGADDIGQLGQAGLGQSLVPLSVALPVAATQIVTESNHVCVIGGDGALVCWGENIEGEIGQADSPPFVSQFAPVSVGTDHDWTAVDTGQGHTCGLRGPGDLYCWGRNTSSQLGLGDGAPEQTRVPTRVGTATYSRIHAGQNHTCGIRTDGSLECWGDNQFGNLGTGDRVAHSSPIRIGDQQDWLEISLDTFHSCAIDASSHLFCWGRNVEGQLGVGDTDDRLSPTPIPGEGFTQVAVGRFHTCALKSDDSVWCTGANDSSQLGLGDTERRSAFTELSFP